VERTTDKVDRMFCSAVRCADCAFIGLIIPSSKLLGYFQLSLRGQVEILFVQSRGQWFLFVTTDSFF
jgi:hypothetical protein